MTYSEDFVPLDDAQELEGPSHPVVFGIELTPKIQGIVIALLGIGGAAYLFTLLVQPVQVTKNEVQTRVEDQRALFANQEAELARIEAVQQELQDALNQRAAVYSLLGTPESLDTLLLDSNQQVKTSNLNVAERARSNLSSIRSNLARSGASNTQIDIRMVQLVQELLVGAGDGEGVEQSVTQTFLVRFSDSLQAEGYSAAQIEEVFFPGVREALTTLGYTAEQINEILTPPVPIADLRALLSTLDEASSLGQKVAPFTNTENFESTELYFLARFRQELSTAGYSDAEISARVDQVLDSPLLQALLYRAELVQFSPVGLPRPVGDELGVELNGKLERQIIQVTFRGLFDQTQAILRNIERLEPLIIIRDFDQTLSEPPSGTDEETMNALGISRPTSTTFTMEVLVPLSDPQTPPEIPVEAPPAEGEGTEGEAPAEGTTE